ncbi:unnamed protein product [Rangifer tarandus platyrhynchus]|uniref:Uncharacterized protein n=2 Tax=Rangifer tarandus platyrhynchus TaxID=3082113 RepID=A0ACB0F001_RANTA|nr:unnamed protein product [Rangifer tarandus platyrhynchus]CAI9706275.1 unnamed protein product [Rangifer tarandus platyrhynchus]
MLGANVRKGKENDAMKTKTGGGRKTKGYESYTLKNHSLDDQSWQYCSRARRKPPRPPVGQTHRRAEKKPWAGSNSPAAPRIPAADPGTGRPAPTSRGRTQSLPATRKSKAVGRRGARSQHYPLRDGVEAPKAGVSRLAPSSGPTAALPALSGNSREGRCELD